VSYPGVGPAYLEQTVLCLFVVAHSIWAVSNAGEAEYHRAAEQFYATVVFVFFAYGTMRRLRVLRYYPRYATLPHRLSAVSC